jgi:hypothetical protein
VRRLTEEPALFFGPIVIPANPRAATIRSQNGLPKAAFGKPVEMSAENRLHIQAREALQDGVGIYRAAPNRIA